MTPPHESFFQRHLPEFMQAILHKRAQELSLGELEDLQLQLGPVTEYVHRTWSKLIRTHADLFLDALYDPKVPRDPEAKRLLYISAKEDPKEVQALLDHTRETLIEKIICGELEDISEHDLPEIEIRQMPPLAKQLKIDAHEHSLMYLPYPYVVPGPRFNEMYNWDTAFIVRGLLQDDKYDLAKCFVENMLYQVEHYGTILNGNRTYYYHALKSRSQPPLLTGKIVAIYHNYDKLRQEQEESRTEWLKRALATAEKYYEHWMTKPHLHEESGLSMYSSEIGDPAFEVIHSEKAHYEKALEQLRIMYEHQCMLWDERKLIYQDRKDRYYLSQYYDPGDDGKRDGLTPRFFMGDRAMRETGFDPSRRFGFFNVDVINYLPVCLNSLRYKMEKEMGELYLDLSGYAPDATDEDGKSYREKATEWEARAQHTARLFHQWHWDEGEQDDTTGEWTRKPCFHDYNVNDELCEKYNLPRFRDYDFVTSFYPMWVGLATDEQAAKVVEHLLPRLQTEWGIMTSSRETGSQWDKPFMWAPLVVVAVEALERYGYYEEALEISVGFLRLMVKDFQQSGKLYEKYDAIRGTSDVTPMIHMGYSENVEGFGWTNSAVLELSCAVDRLSAHIEAAKAS